MIAVSRSRDYFRAAKGLFSILRDPDDTRSVFEITEGLQESQAAQRMLAYVREQPENERMLAARYLAPLPDLDALLRLPAGSLGHVFATRMRAMKLDVEFYPSFQVTSDATYIGMRLRQTHDIWHTVTGFDTSVAGELGLQAFMLAQLSSPLSAALIGGTLLRWLLGKLPKGPELPVIMDAVAQGWRMGRAARPLFGQRWEEGWARPLTEWQAALCVNPVEETASARAAA